MLHSLEIAASGAFALLGASLIVGGLARWMRVAPFGQMSASSGQAAFLFEGNNLVDATASAHRLLQDRGNADLAHLLTLLSPGFGPDLGQRLAALPSSGRLLLASPTGMGTLEAAEEGGALRLTFRPQATGATALDRLALDAASNELAILRGLAQNAPQPIWMLDAAGHLTWANQAYLALADLMGAPPGAGTGGAPAGSGAAWPATSLFDTPGYLADGQRHKQRLPLRPPGWKEPIWHDVTSVRRGHGSLHFATDVSGLVLAESARLHFVQTLAKTFAHLRTGLAIFDRERRLVLFNPAFLDLTGLPSTFLSACPTVPAVFDRLREARILPEPRDYANWREEISALESAAAQGQYRETWTLPSGQTYRVIGRPHPDGALAFLFEDISDEVGLTRRFRAELEASRAVLDALEEAVAVFSPTGALSLSNAAYDQLWGASDRNFREAELIGEVARWEAVCSRSPIWDRLRATSPNPMLQGGGATLNRPDGRRISLRISPLPGGATLVTFRPRPEDNFATNHVFDSSTPEASAPGTRPIQSADLETHP